MTAQEARKIAEVAKAFKSEEQYHDIMKKIKEAADLGDFSITYMYITDVNLKRLELEGYVIIDTPWDKYCIRW